MIVFFHIAVHLTALILLSILTFRLWRNLRFLRHVGELTGPPLTPPSVSVLVPARNEARSIVASIESLARQDYPYFKIITLNDQSSDETGALLDKMAGHHPSVTVLHGTENPPAGWNGKSYACHRLAERAAGEWLLFTDADTLHTPVSIAQGVEQAERLGVDLLSVFPKQITKSWSEQIFVSFILDFLPMLTLDLGAIWHGNSSSIAANGQYLLIRASTYRATGGHQAISEALVDDFALAAHVRASGYRIAFVDGTSMLGCRMYQNAREVWQGFSKNILLALEMTSTQKQRWWSGLLFAWGYACVFIMPVYHLLFSGQIGLALLEIGWLGVLRGIVNWHFTRPLNEIAATPLAAWGVMAFGLAALFRRKQGKQIKWKGRNYPATH